jgi:hypothetical protein
MTNYELVGETTGAKTQNEEWFATDLQIYLKPKHCHFDIGISNNSDIEVTFDGGANWADFTKGKQLEVTEEYHCILKPGDLFNLRATGGSGTTVDHCAIYAEV